MNKNFGKERSESIRKYISNRSILNNKDFLLSNEEISNLKLENRILKIKYNL